MSGGVETFVFCWLLGFVSGRVGGLVVEPIMKKLGSYHKWLGPLFVSRKVYERLGMICGEYSHAWADSDYAMMAKRAGIGVVSAGVVGRANGHSNRPSLRGLSIRERIKMLRNPKGWNLHDLWLYRRRNWGYCAAFASCAHMLCHVVFAER